MMWKCINFTVYAQVSECDRTLPLSLRWFAPSSTDAKHSFCSRGTNKNCLKALFFGNVLSIKGWVTVIHFSPHCTISKFPIILRGKNTEGEKQYILKTTKKSNKSFTFQAFPWSTLQDSAGGASVTVCILAALPNLRHCCKQTADALGGLFRP